MPNARTAGADQFVEELILTLRGRRVILAGDLAGIYGVDAKRLNEQVRRSSDRFPADFVFRLTQEEFEEMGGHRRAGRLDEVHIVAPDRVLDLEVHLAIREALYDGTPHAEPELLSNGLG